MELKNYFAQDSKGNALPGALLSSGPRQLLPGATTVLSQNSIPDGPISAKATALGSEYAPAWVPSHGGDTGCVRDLVRSMKIGDAEIGPDIADVPVSLVSIPTDSALVITQTFSAYNPEDSDGLYKMWDGVMRHTFDRFGWRFEYDIAITSDLSAVTGYPSISMACVSTSSVVDTLRLADGNELPILDAEMRSTDLSATQPWVAMLNSDTGVVAACSYWNLGNIIGDGPGARQRLTERTQGYAKLYTTRWDNETVSAGTSVFTRARVFLADGVDADLIW